MNTPPRKPASGHEHTPDSVGTSGYPEPTPRRNDKHDMPDKGTPHEHQNLPQQKPQPSSN